MMMLCSPGQETRVVAGVLLLLLVCPILFSLHKHKERAKRQASGAQTLARFVCARTCLLSERRRQIARHNSTAQMVRRLRLRPLASITLAFDDPTREVKVQRASESDKETEREREFRSTSGTEILIFVCLLRLAPSGLLQAKRPLKKKKKTKTTTTTTTLAKGINSCETPPSLAAAVAVANLVNK